MTLRKTNTSLPGSSTQQNASYGLAPMFKQNVSISTVTRRDPIATPNVSINDRVINSQALVLSTVAEHSLPFTMVPVMINLAQELSKDSRALSRLSVDRTSASYKMRFGLAKTLEQKTINNIQKTFFSLNIDESTSNNSM